MVNTLLILSLHAWDIGGSVFSFTTYSEERRVKRLKEMNEKEKQ